jgi:outer membrane protein
LSLNVSIPLFDRLSTSTARQQARLQADNARLDMQQKRQAVALDVRRVWLDRQAAIAQLEAAGARLEAAEKALQATTERYRVGAATLLEVTQARAAQVESASALVNARYSLMLQGTLLAYQTGDLNPATAILTGQ